MHFQNFRKIQFKYLKKAAQIAILKNKKKIEVAIIIFKTLRFEQKYFAKEALVNVLVIEGEFQNENPRILIKKKFQKNFILFQMI